jgi:hypothetical protein
MADGREIERGEGGLEPLSAPLGRVLQSLSEPKRRLLAFASEDPAGGVLYQHSVLCQMSMPYRDPGAERHWQRKNGYLTLELAAGRAFDQRVEGFVDVGLPFGPKPRLVLYHLNTEAVRTQHPRIELEETLTTFVRRVGIDPCGRNVLAIKDQLTRLAAADFRIGKAEGAHSITVQGRILSGFALWTPKDASVKNRWAHEVQFSPEYFESLMAHAVPLNEAAIGHLSHNAMALDIYTWLAQRLHRIDPQKPSRVSWESLQEQFGSGYAQLRDFRRVFNRTLLQVRVVYPDARLEVGAQGVSLLCSRPPVARRLLPLAGFRQ